MNGLTNKKPAAKKRMTAFFAAVGLIAATAVVTLSMFYGRERIQMSIQAAKFYFSSDMLLEEKDADEPVYIYSNEISFNLFNYAQGNTEKFMEKDIEYKVWTEVSSNVTVKISGESGVIAGKEPNSASVYVYLDGCAAEEKVVIYAETAGEYRKVLKRIYEVRQSEAGDFYEITDKAGAEYAELLIMTNNNCQPSLVWNVDELKIDSTNSYVNCGYGEYFPSNYESGANMFLSQPASAGSSISIIFYKRNPDLDYSVERRPITGPIELPRFE